MKKIYYIISSLLLFSLYNCSEDPLDKTPVNFFDMEYVFTDSIRAEAFVNNMLTERPDEINASYNRYEGNSMLAAASDEATHVSTNKNARYAPQKMSAGLWGPTNMRLYRSDDGVGNVGAWYRWGGYCGIRKANKVLEGLQMMNDRHAGERFRKRMEGEALFHLALSHFWLFQKWGGIPIVDKVYDDEEVIETPRASVEEIVNFILRICDEAYECFPEERYTQTHEIGRYDRGAVLALKSRVLLYAASPLYNGTGFDGQSNPLICYGNTDNKRWEKAAKAAQDLIDFGWYSLYVKNKDASLTQAKASENYASYFNYWNQSTINPEIIIVGRIRAANRNTEADNFPAGFTNAKGGTCPSQEMVDAYEMSDGTLFDWNNPEHKKNPYANRDPRFYASIIYHGATYAKFSGESNYTFDISEEGVNKRGQAATTTGYYLNKFMDYSVVNIVTNSGSVDHVWSHFRHAETYLNLAEAGNEFNGPNYMVPGAKNPITPVQALNLIRARSGMPTVEATFAKRGIELNKENLREFIRQERRIELAFEEHRFYDVRRWMTIKDGLIHGVKITKINDESNYEIVDVEKKVFDNKKHYFFPIPYKEIFVNRNLQQNPGW
ncbi:hypothetical protein M2451_003750 [Dysgonomonas sp. PFB1-18]|uniref:RagB/SusD family nutrient uptake outer membrane protein n=1 Tax=unclassified Dysgonomonas TaxID=2630389 RepID=UPI002473B4BE|nr:MULTISPECIES: RagB/SusD family nutrient uptake outer membrane protein [unclassified Dysgonomonas]MDH6310980.1 hypothetical protein [Dysgonomonas sp. PF1-14]MDH6340805.1 hypothetical protein [Dysgonomonas sp. PF1-16]MDH6382409.1 hypothetical protein [Dysgonomonas sp. PFB1-18]MDH6399774.1 hypothetical protein [Dysgonomonas sp. PF1-23]